MLDVGTSMPRQGLWMIFVCAAGAGQCEGCLAVEKCASVAWNM